MKYGRSTRWRFPDAKISPKELALANQLIDSITSKAFDPTQYKDDVKDRIEAQIQKKVEGEEITVPEDGRTRKRESDRHHGRVACKLEAQGRQRRRHGWFNRPRILGAQGGGQAAGGEKAGEKVGEESRRPYSAQSRVSWIKILPGFADGAICRRHIQHEERTDGAKDSDFQSNRKFL